MSLRSVADPAAAIQRTVRELDQQAQDVNLRTMNDVVDTSLLQERFVAQFGSSRASLCGVDCFFG